MGDNGRLIRAYAGYILPVNVISYICAMLILIYIVVEMKKLMSASTKKRLDDIYFLRSCNIVILRGILFFLLAVTSFLLSFRNIYKVVMTISLFIISVDTLLKFIFPLTWLVFFDYFVYKSSSRILNKYRFALVPFMVVIVLRIAFWISYRIELARHPEPIAGYRPLFITLHAANEYALFLIGAAYMIYAYMIIRTYHKEMKQPLFMRLDIFIVPWILGVVLDYILGVRISVLFSSIAILLTFFSIRNRYRYMYPNTEFYNETFIPYLEKYLEKNNIEGGSVIFFYSKDNTQALGDILWQYRIPKSIVIRMNNGGYAMIADVKNISGIDLCCSLISDAARQEKGFAVETGKWMRSRKESVKDFTQRVLGEIGKRATDTI